MFARTASRGFALYVGLTILLAGAAPALAQVRVSVDQAPTRVTPGSTYEIVWTVTGSPDRHDPNKDIEVTPVAPDYPSLTSMRAGRGVRWGHWRPR